ADDEPGHLRGGERVVSQRRREDRREDRRLRVQSTARRPVLDVSDDGLRKGNRRRLREGAEGEGFSRLGKMELEVEGRRAERDRQQALHRADRGAQHRRSENAARHHGADGSAEARGDEMSRQTMLRVWRAVGASMTAIAMMMMTNA